MRGMAEAFSGMPVQMTEGIRAEIDGGWVLVLPHPTEPTVQLFAEGTDADGADALLATYRDLVTGLVTMP
jgi:mannose-1-phosphate guanylyltransferase/phosphomannomutase